MKTKNAIFVEAKVRELVTTNGISPLELVVGVHNACSHGDLWPTVNFGPDDKYLGEMFDGFDTSIAGAEKAKKKLTNSRRRGRVSAVK